MRPVILEFCTDRVDSPEKPFYYDNQLNLNIVKVGSRKIPFVDMETVELMTKTKIARESDDEYIDTLELLTKTNTAREQDD